MNRSRRKQIIVACAMIALAVIQSRGMAAPFTASYTDGGTWNEIYGQGFNAFINDGMSELIEFGDPVPLSRFEFFKSGFPDTASNFKLAIISPFFTDFSGGLTTSSPSFVGVSTNTIASTSSLATGAPIRFDFDDLPLTFGESYGAIFVNIDDAGNVTPVIVSGLTADYVVADPNAAEPIYVPESNYDENPPAAPIDYLNSSTVIRYELATTDFPDTQPFSYFVPYGYGGDANFIAYFDYDFPAGTPGDFDGDEDVDGRDFLAWQRGDSPSPLSATDLADWQNGYDSGGLAAVNAVPEPASIIIIFVLPLGLLFRQRGQTADA
jgi:hypothetical protein